MRNKYANIKSRVDQSDPNPAHKLQNSVKDLTVDSEEGRQINPRFSSQSFAPSPSSLIQRRKTTDFNDRFPLSTCHKKSPLAGYRLQKSWSVDSHFSRRQPRSLDCTYPLGRKQKLSKMSSFEERQTPQSSHHSSTFETIEEDEIGVAATADSTELAKRITEPEAFSAGSSVEDPTELTKTGSSGDDDDSADGVGVCGMEITNDGSETTVVLQHILALSASRGSSSSSSTDSKKRTSPLGSPHHQSSMAIIEEDEVEEEEDYFESPDTPQTPMTPMTPATAKIYTLAHPIPRLVVTEEGGDLVETVVENSTVFTGSILPLISISLPSTNPTIEEEEELESIHLSTRL